MAGCNLDGGAPSDRGAATFSSAPMHDAFAPLKPSDYAFLVDLLESPVNLADGAELRRRLRVYEAEGTPEARAALDGQLDRTLRYLGSADAAYFVRRLVGREPGVPLREVVRDVSRALDVDVPAGGAQTEREMIESLVEAYAARAFAELSTEQQQRMLVELGVEQERAAQFVLKSAGVFSLPLLVAAFDAIVVQGLIRNVVFGAIARIVGKGLSARLFALLAARMPWWVGWIGPAAWTLSIGWTAADLQGPARRKTVPAVLYLGLCALREGRA